MRQYANINGFPQATHVRAVSKSFMFGKTIVTIDYRDYHIQLLALPKRHSHPRAATIRPQFTL